MHHKNTCIHFFFVLFIIVWKLLVERELALTAYNFLLLRLLPFFLIKSLVLSETFKQPSLSHSIQLSLCHQQHSPYTRPCTLKSSVYVHVSAVQPHLIEISLFSTHTLTHFLPLFHSPSDSLMHAFQQSVLTSLPVCFSTQRNSEMFL